MKSGPIISRPATIINSIVRTILLPSCTLLRPSSSLPPPREREAHDHLSADPFRNDEPLRFFFFFFFSKYKRYKLGQIFTTVPLRLTRSSLNFITRPFPVQCIVVHFNVGDRHRLLLNRWQEVYYQGTGCSAIFFFF